MTALPPQEYCLVYLRPSADTNFLTILNRGLNYSSWKTIVKIKTNKYEENAWIEYALSHPNLHIAQVCLENVPPHMF